MCEICNKIIYVGETGDILYQRHLLNLSLIRRKVDDSVTNHFYTNNHTVDFCDWIGKTLPKRILQEKKYGEFAEKETEHL